MTNWQTAKQLNCWRVSPSAAQWFSVSIWLFVSFLVSCFRLSLFSSLAVSFVCFLVSLLGFPLFLAGGQAGGRFGVPCVNLRTFSPLRRCSEHPAHHTQPHFGYRAPSKTTFSLIRITSYQPCMLFLATEQCSFCEPWLKFKLTEERLISNLSLSLTIYQW